MRGIRVSLLMGAVLWAFVAVLYALTPAVATATKQLCGKEWQACCHDDTCPHDDALTCVAGKCMLMCGGEKERCCDDQCGNGYGCIGGHCKPCGDVRQTPCPGMQAVTLGATVHSRTPHC
jgi:hypothetical protein